MFFQWVTLIWASKHPFGLVFLRVYIVFSVSRHARALSGVFSITRIELLIEILSH
jgi:hypothetical protein